MRRRHIVALCLMVGALIAAAITPGVIAGRKQVKPTVPPGFTIDRQTTDPQTGAVTTSAHKGPRELKPGDWGYVPEPKPGERGHEGPTP